MTDNITANICYGILSGIGATVIFDLWGLVLKLLFKIPQSNICFVGRWFLYMPSGKFTHSNLAKAEPLRFECPVGWVAHYIIGSSLGVIFIFIAGNEWYSNPAIIPALLFGILSAAAPLFIMQPAFGFGFAGSKTPNPAQTRMRSILNHFAFGLGLYITALFINFVMNKIN